MGVDVEGGGEVPVSPPPSPPESPPPSPPPPPPPPDPDPEYSPEAEALFARFSNQPSDTYKDAIDDFYTTTGMAAILAKLDALYCLALHDTQAITRNWVADAYNLTLHGTTTHTPGLQLKANGTTGYAATGANLQSLTHLQQNSACMFAYFAEAAVSGSIIGTDSSGDAFRMTVGTTQIISRIHDTTSLSNNHGGDGSGLFASARSGASAKRNTMNGTIIGSGSTTSSQSPINENIVLFRNGSSYSGSGIAFAGFGANLTDEELGTLNTAMAAFLAAVNP